MDENVQKLSNVIIALRGLFKDKDRLVGVDDWDTLIGCLMLLEEVGNNLTEAAAEPQKTTAEE